MKICLFGGSGGLGKQLSVLMEQEKYDIVSLSSKDLDLTNKKEVDIFFEKNDIDVVVNLAVYNYDCFIHKYNTENLSHYDKQIKVNINGSLNILSACLPKMRSKKYGRIVFASSIVSDNPQLGTSIYSASKKYNESLIKSCCIENAVHNITANTIQLGYFDGGLLYKIDEDKRNTIKNNIPMKRWGTVEELKNTIIFLINTPYVNGSVIKIAGGL
jgi:NAD(P)-dependent dehydrogenase (short-subunit alcohol dehydrogenase family)